MLSHDMEKGLNDQMNFEMYSANIYMSMGAYFDSLSLDGFANWMKVQYQEEMFHHSKFYHFIDERGSRITISAMDAPQVEWDSPLAVFEDALNHERIVTDRINNLMTMALAEKDHATASFLQWFVSEQVEEEASVDTVIQKLKLVDGSQGGIFMINQELSQRVFTPPASDGG